MYIYFICSITDSLLYIIYYFYSYKYIFNIGKPDVYGRVPLVSRGK